MAANREERFLMRQRGAGTRQIQEFGFDIALPGVSRSPLRPIRSGRSRRTPQPELPPQRSSRRTPRSTPLFLNQSSGPTPATFNPKEAKESKESAKTRNQLTTQRLNSQSTRRDDSGTVTKKRRLADTPRSVEQLHTPIAKSTTNSSLNNPIGLEPQPSTLDSQARVDKEATEQARDGIVVSKNDQSPAVAHSSTKKRRKKRKSIVQTIRKRTSLGPRQPTLQRAIIPPPPPPITSDSSELPNQLPDDSSQLSRTIHSPLRSPRENLAQRKKRKKRVSIGRLPKHRKQPVKGLHATPTSLADSSISITRGQNRFPDSSSLPLEEIRESRRNRLPVLDAEEESHEEVGRENQYEEEDRIQVGKPRRKGLGDSTRLKDASVQDYLGGERVSAKNQGLNTSEREATSQERSERDSQDVESTPSLVTTKIRQKRRSVKRTSDSVPIAVHRLSQIQEVDEEEDARTDSIPLPKKVSVTAIDVLGQICRETIEKTMETMKKGAQHERNDRSRAEWERRQNCIEKYGDELDKRLFQMAEALNNNQALKSRLRRANKEVAAVREELLALRREREAIALQTDEVRVKHERDSRKAQNTEGLNTLAQDIRLAVLRGRALQDDADDHAQAKEKNQPKSIADIEYSLGQVARNVSSANGSGSGLLQRVKDFNSLLEKTISAI